MTGTLTQTVTNAQGQVTTVLARENYADTPREMGIDLSTVASGTQARWLKSAPGNVTTTYDHDALDSLITITDPAVQDTALAYDERDNLISVTDPNNVTTTYVRDGLDNLLSESSPDVGTTVHTYDAVGNRIQSKEARPALSFIVE